MIDSAVRIPLVTLAVAAICAALYFAVSVFAPVAIALFVIAVVWPLQARLEARMPKPVALVVTVGAALAVCCVYALLGGWAFGRIGQSMLADASRYQAIYANVVAWLEGHGISVGNFWAENFSTAWVLGMVRDITGRVNTTVTFWLIAFTYIILGLLEVDDVERKVAALSNRRAARVVLEGSRATAMKLRRYVVVRTQMSLITGVAVWAISWLAGLPYAVEWGVIAFLLNYIPFIGPFVATLLPVAFAIPHYLNWEMPLLLFVGFNAVQFVVGTYIEPRVSGNAVAMSPSLVVFAIFFWAFMWGIFGAFIGVPITIAVLTFCAQDPATRWLAEVCGAAPQEGPAAPSAEV